jgi:hypothetical protein
MRGGEGDWQAPKESERREWRERPSHNVHRLRLKRFKYSEGRGCRASGRGEHRGGPPGGPDCVICHMS